MNQNSSVQLTTTPVWKGQTGVVAKLPLTTSFREIVATKHSCLCLLGSLIPMGLGGFSVLVGAIALNISAMVVGVILFTIGMVAALTFSEWERKIISLPIYLPDGRRTRELEDDRKALASTGYAEVANALYDETVTALRNTTLRPAGLIWWDSANQHAITLNALRKRAEHESEQMELDCVELDGTVTLRQAQVILSSTAISTLHI